MTIDEQIKKKKEQANLAWQRFMRANQDANDGNVEIARLLEEIHANNRQELLIQVIAHENLRRMIDAQGELDEEARRACRESDEIEDALRQLLASRDRGHEGV